MARGKRSPKYPFIPLSRALERADELYRKEGRNYAPMAVAMGTWGYKPKSSGGLQTVAALIGYGLLEDVGTGQSRKVRITERARRILLDQRADSSDRLELIREAALSPEIFESLWSEWRQDGIPSPANMHHTLVFEHNFNENTANDFIRVFTETLEFARLKDLSVPEDSKIEAVGDQSLTEDRQSAIPATRAHTLGRMPHAGVEMQEATFPLQEGLAVIQWPKELSPESYEDFDAWVQLTLRRAKRSVVKHESERDSEGDEIE